MNSMQVAAEEPRLADDDYITAQDWPEAPSIGAEAAVLIEADSGTVLYAKNADSKRYPASITKILTALVTLEDSSLADPLVFEGEALEPLPEGYVSIHPTAGEQMSVEDCLYALLLESANDAANALAVHDEGTIAKFARKMNERAALAGAKHTHFTNPSGLSDAEHYTTPYDMARIMRDCIQNEEFLEIAGKTVYTIPATNTSAARTVYMRHEMLKQNTANYYEYCVAGKTGFTTPSGYTLITYVKKGDLKLICCVMQCEKGVQYQSTRALFDYGFENFQMLTEAEAASEKVYMNTDHFALNQIQRAQGLSFALEKVEASSILLPGGCTTAELETSMQLLDPQKEVDSCFAKVTYLWEGMEMGSVRLRMHVVSEQEETNRENQMEESVEIRPFSLVCRNGKEAGMLFIASIAGIVILLVGTVVVCLHALKKAKKNRAVSAGGETDDVEGETAETKAEDCEGETAETKVESCEREAVEPKIEGCEGETAEPETEGGEGETAEPKLEDCEREAAVLEAADELEQDVKENAEVQGKDAKESKAADGQ